MRRRTFILAATLFACLAPAPLFAAHIEQDTVLAAKDSGTIRPLPEILAIVRKEVPGRIVDVQLNKKRVPWRYRIKVLTEAGNVVKVTVDAESGKILKIKGKR